MPKSEPSDNAANNSASRTLLPAGITPTEQSYDLPRSLIDRLPDIDHGAADRDHDLPR
jgi:hypothetical protein